MAQSRTVLRGFAIHCVTVPPPSVKLVLKVGVEPTHAELHTAVITVFTTSGWSERGDLNAQELSV